MSDPIFSESSGAYFEKPFSFSQTGRRVICTTSAKLNNSFKKDGFVVAPLTADYDNFRQPGLVNFPLI